MKHALDLLLPRLVGEMSIDWKIIDHGSKQKLLAELPARMRAYADWPHPSPYVLVLVDRDQDECRPLKGRLEQAAIGAGFATKSSPNATGQFQVVNRIVIEELEAWFFGDIPALVKAYPKVPSTLASKAGFRDSDAIRGGTWEKLRHVLQHAGYYSGSTGFPKIEVARRVTEHMDMDTNRSPSFRVFKAGLEALLSALGRMDGFNQDQPARNANDG